MTTKFAELQIEQVQIHPKNVRTDVGNVVDLANSITAQGIMQPLVVAPSAATPEEGVDNLTVDLGTYIIIAGHRRHAAAQLANLDVLPCVIREDLDTESKQLEAMLVENTQRTDLTLMEEATAYQGLLDLPGYSAKELAKKVGRSQKFVKDRAKLTTIPAEAKAKLEAKQMTIEDGLIFAEFAGDVAATEQLINAHGSYNWEWTLRCMRERRQEQATAAKLKAEVKADGATVIERPENLYTHEAEYKDTTRYPDFNGWNTAQHIEAGHLAVVDGPTRGKVLWLVPADQAPELPDDEPTETPEQAAERQRIEDLNAGLKVAAQVRHEHLRTQMLKPTPTVLEYARQAKIKQLFKQLRPEERSMYLNVAEDAKPAAVTAALDALTTDQLDALKLIAGHSYEDQQLSTYAGWGPTSYGSDWAKSWRELITDAFDYQLSDIEREAIRVRDEKTAAEIAAIAARDAARASEEEQDDE